MNAQSVASMTSREWFKRPADQKFSDLDEIYRATLSRKQRSRQEDRKMSQVLFEATDDNDIHLLFDGGKHGPAGRLKFTHWSFGQLGNKIGAHPEFLRELPSRLSTDVLNFCWHEARQVQNKNLGLMVTEAEEPGKMPVLQALTSSQYGRIWDSEVAMAAMEIIDATGGRFYSPIDWGGEKRALFSSDRDIHMLFIDGGSIMDAGMTWDHKPDGLHRGWLIGNSEVGLRSLYIATFLFRIVCGNFCIHGITNVDFKSLRHTALAPAKFAKEVAPALRAYVEESPKKLEGAIKKMQLFELPKALDEQNVFFRNRGFTSHETSMARMTANKEEGGSHTVWQMMNGFTKYAQKIPHRDTRAALEAKAGKLMEQFSA